MKMGRFLRDILYIIVGTFLLSTVIILYDNYTSPVPVTTKNATQSDLNKFSAYHKQLVEIVKPLDEAREAYQMQAKIALKNGNPYALYNSAKNLHDASMDALFSLSKISAPDLDNEDAQESFSAVQDNFNTYVGALRQISSTMMGIANTGNPTPEALNNMQQYTEMYKTASVNFTISLIKTYSSLGINDLQQIDMDNGGYIPAMESSHQS